MIIEEKKKNEIVALHTQWLNTPITNLVFQALEQFEKELVGKLTEGSISNTVSDAYIRQSAINLRNTQHIMKMMRSSDSLIQLLEK